MGRPTKPVVLPVCQCDQHTCEIHGIHRRRTFQRVGRWYRDGKISREAYEKFRAEAGAVERGGSSWRGMTIN